MLILTRYPGETIVISVPGQQPIRFTVLAVNGKQQVTIGTDAELHIGVDREEIYQRKQADKHADAA